MTSPDRLMTVAAALSARAKCASANWKHHETLQPHLLTVLKTRFFFLIFLWSLYYAVCVDV